jgi:hypothetical protein
MRRPGLVEAVQNDCRVMITGPANLAAMLNSLQMGFKTLAIEKRSSEVWSLLGMVKTEFAKFGDVVEATKKSIDAAAKKFDEVGVRTRAIQRKLRDVQDLPAPARTSAAALAAPRHCPGLDDDRPREHAALARLIAGQICVHACMAGMRLATPLLALREGYSAAAVGVLLALFALTQVFLACRQGAMQTGTASSAPWATRWSWRFAGRPLSLAFPVFSGVVPLAALMTGGASGAGHHCAAAPRGARRARRHAAQAGVQLAGHRAGGVQLHRALLCGADDRPRGQHSGQHRPGIAPRLR